MSHSHSASFLEGPGPAHHHAPSQANTCGEDRLKDNMLDEILTQYDVFYPSFSLKPSSPSTLAHSVFLTNPRTGGFHVTLLLPMTNSLRWGFSLTVCTPSLQGACLGLAHKTQDWFLSPRWLFLTLSPFWRSWGQRDFVVRSIWMPIWVLLTEYSWHILKAPNSPSVGFGKWEVCP